MKPKKCVRAIPWLFLLTGFCALISPAAFANRPNVVLIVCDDLNDYITGIPGEQGHPQSITPHIERLARSGVAFRRAYSNNPVCAPSRSSFLTGIYPHNSGNLFWGKWWENRILNNSRTLMEHFRANGYHVVGTGKLMHHHKRDVWSEFIHKADYGPVAYDGKNRVAHPGVPKPFGDIGAIDGSFGSFESSTYLTDDDPDTGWIYGSWDGPPQPFDPATDPTPDERNAAWAAERIAHWSENRPEKPFFMAVGFLRPHTPCVVAQRYFDRFPLDDIELPEVLEGDAQDTHFRDLILDAHKGPRYYRTLLDSYADPETALKHFIQAYLASVTAVDECIGQVVEALDQSPFRDNTIVVVTSDHGWQMGQKEFLFKNSPWEESTRIPMVIRAPGISREGGIAEHPVSLIDLYPTLVDLCHLEGDTRKSSLGLPLDGHSMRPFLENPASGQWTGPQGALSMIFVGDTEEGYSHEERQLLGNQNWTYRTEDWRYILYRDGSEELYDHEADPREWHNLAGSPAHSSIKAHLKAALLELIGKPLNTSLPPVSAQPAKPTAQWNWFDAIDTDRNGKATLEEWLSWMENKQKRKGWEFVEARAKKLFKSHDLNGDGWLSRQELDQSTD
jgi:arylsulfatase A-like enzyme